MVVRLTESYESSRFSRATVREIVEEAVDEAMRRRVITSSYFAGFNIDHPAFHALLHEVAARHSK